ncbi:HNH endonuclease signature motif containing protein [Actinotalea subterranea]|uniref:HNH endonuclease signature motif containing protein n=1 Tax=Actinotalea subterranea TaxID=2607497 RepID=UPI0011EDD7C5|nr:HNH endonuclease signature motif containing protein [Actinotalea subterranea]
MSSSTPAEPAFAGRSSAAHHAADAVPTGTLARVQGWVERHPLAASLEAAVPSGALAAGLSSLDLAAIDDVALVEVVAAWERIASWVAAAQATGVAELVRRAAGGAGDEFVADELAARLATSRRSAANTVALAVALDEAPEVHDALAAGRVDVRKARVLTEDLSHLPRTQQVAIRAALLPDAAARTAPQLRLAARRAELVLDPDAAARRSERAAARRCVSLTPAPDSMAWLTAYLPAVDATTVLTAVDAIAATSAPDDARPMDARRADALVDVMRSVLDSGVAPHGEPLPEQQRRRPHVRITMSAETLLGLSARPAELAGYGPIPPDVARLVATDATWQGVLTDLAQGGRPVAASAGYRPSAALVEAILDRDPTCTFPGCRVPAPLCDVDHIDPYRAPPGHPAEPGRGGRAQAGVAAGVGRRDAPRPAAARRQTRADNLQPLCRHHHRLKTFSRWGSNLDPATGVLTWTAPNGTQYTREPITTLEVDPPYRRTRLRARPADAPLGARPSQAGRERGGEAGPRRRDGRRPRDDRPPF